MKKILLVAMVCMAFGFYKKTADIIATLGLQEQTARNYILRNFVGDFTYNPTKADENPGENNIDKQLATFRIPYTKLLPAVIQGDKAATAKELCAYVKQYVNSEEFAAEYTKQREKAKPTEEPWRPDAEQIKAQEQLVKDSEKNLADARKNKHMPANAIAQMEKNAADSKRQLEQWKDPTPNRSAWNKLYPENPAVVIKQRLQEYLTLAATVDFNATLTTVGRKNKFTKPEYESKSLKWKAIYRAGKEVNDAVTSFVKEWLKGEIIAATKTKMPVNSTENKTETAIPAKLKIGDKQENEKTSEEPAAKKEKKSLFKKIKEKIDN